MAEIYDSLFEAMANEQRRRVLFDLVGRDSRDELPIYIDAPPDATGDRNTAGIEQYHVHLPKLDDYGFIDWDRATNAVEPGDRFADVRPILTLLRDRQADAPFELV